MHQRQTIAFFLAELEGSYASLLCRGAADGAKEHDVNLILLPGKALNVPYQYQYQYNVIYDLINDQNVDALVLPTPIYNNYVTPEAFELFYQSYRPLPIISLSLPLEGAANIIADNKKGLRDLIQHLIREHGRERIAFIKGPENNDEAKERYQVYLDVLSENQIAFDPQLVCPGDFSKYSAVDAVTLLLEGRQVQFDALVAANDEMAITALEALQAKGVKVPEDVAVAGYDDVEWAKLANPALTTVMQPIYEMARNAIGEAVALIHGEPPRTTVFDTKAVIRESCGCKTKLSQTEFDQEMSAFLQQNPDFEQVEAMISAQEFNQSKSMSLSQTHIREMIQLTFAALSNSAESGLVIPKLIDVFRLVTNESALSDEGFLYLQSLVNHLRQTTTLIVTDPQKALPLLEIFNQMQNMLLESFQLQSAERRKHIEKYTRNLRAVLDRMVLHINDSEVGPILAVSSELKDMGINACYIYLYDEAITHMKGQAWKTPDRVKLVLAYDGEESIDIHQNSLSFLTRDILRNLPKNRRCDMVLNPIFFLQDQIGFILCEFYLKDKYMYESLFMEIGCILKLSILLKMQEQIKSKLRDALQSLELYNQKLSNLSQTDELTGLYNRRGFLSLVKDSLQLARRMEKGGMLFYADLDGLKKINDTFGHEEGDFAIRKTAELLRKTFRSADIIARLGGDEFTIFTADTTDKIADIIQSRLHQNINDFNSISNKPYQISISMGAVPFNAEGTETIAELMSEADRKLYEQKRAKKQRYQQQQ